VEGNDTTATALDPRTLPWHRRPSPRREINRPQTGPVVGLIAQVLLLAALAASTGIGQAGWLVGLACAVIVNTTLARGLSRHQPAGLSFADWVTVARVTLAVGLAALVAQSFERHTPVAVLASIAALALTLDALDGWVARRQGTTHTLGARFDGEADAFLILILSVYVARAQGAWVLAIGAARYAFLAVGWPLAWMRAPLPARYWRKVVAAIQGVVLTVAAAHVLPPVLTGAALVAALGLLAESFGRDVGWLWNHRHVTRPAIDTPARERMPPAGAAGLTVLAAVVVWVALVAPDRPQSLTPAAFLRLPLEGLVLVALAVVSPVFVRRVLAGVAGPALAVLVILKILNIGFFTAFARPFDLVGDLGNAGFGIETLRASIGGTQADLIVVVALVSVVALIVLTTLAVLWLTRAAARHRRRSLHAVAVLGAVWLLCSISGAQLLSHTPIASTSTAGFFIGELRMVQADIRDQGVFAAEIRHDRFRNTPGYQLLTGLRGKDVLLVFVESYGRIAVQGASFSPSVDALLANGTRRLQAAGFSARSAFLTSSTFGGISWLSHATLQSGVWVGSQRRYNQLVGTDRFTLSAAFRRAGWRTINFAPADDRTWPEGSSFYRYDKLYDRRQMGYHGPAYTYAPMPDQYMFSALQRLELGNTHRAPLFAEVETVSSHMPWNRIPKLIAWRDVGNGSIFNRVATFTEPDSFWWHHDQVKAAYARSIEYSLRTLISFVQRYGRKNLVLIVVGDEQPLALVTGQGASHDVVISVIAHDQSVLKRIAGWGWQPGLLPRPRAPVWPMSAFRDRFLGAFGPQSGSRASG
jgi:phosphatidylglycerophosphate synthase